MGYIGNWNPFKTALSEKQMIWKKKIINTGFKESGKATG